MADLSLNIFVVAFFAKNVVSLIFMLLAKSLLGPRLSRFFLDYFHEISF